MSGTKITRKGRVVPRMLALVAPYKSHFALGQLAMLVGTAAGLVAPWLIRNVFEMLQRGDLGLLLGFTGLLAGAYAIKALADWARTNALEYVGQRMIRDLRAAAYGRLLELSLGYYSGKSSGEIASSMSNDMNLLQQGLASGLAVVLQQAITLVVVVLVLFRLDWVLTCAVLAMLPLVILISKRMGDQVKAIAHHTQERLGSLMTIINESIAGISIIQAFVLEQHALGLFKHQNEQVLSRSLQGIRVTTTARLIISLLNSAFLLVVIGLGAYRASQGILSLPDLIAFILYSEMVAGPVAVLAGVYVEVNRATAAFQRIAGIMEAQPQIADPPQPVTIPEVKGHVRFNQVSFAYDGTHEVLRDIGFQVAPGETIALVGPSGAGKSTLVKLLPRFYDPTRGAITLDGVDIKHLDLQYLRSQIGIVPQEAHLFGLSIGANIACGKPEATDEEIRWAAKLANAHAFIMEQPQGYDTPVGEDGASLSGGQRQRIAIARAFIKNPPILILDEATSALDTLSERQVREAWEKLKAGRTTFVIAHRLSTIQGADRIIVLRDGEILAIGPHEDLVRSCPFYRSLYETQFALASGDPVAETVQGI